MKHFPVDRIVISDQVSGLLVDPAGLQQLACRPDGRAMLGDIEVQDSSPIVAQNDQHKQDLEGRRWDREEIQRNRLLGMILMEGLPRKRRWVTTLDHVLRDSGLGNFDPELEQLAVNPRRAPERIRAAHLTN